MVTVREVMESDRPWVMQFLRDEAGDTRMVSRGTLHHADTLPGFVGLHEGVPVGVLNYKVVGSEMEVVTLYTSVHGKGVGSALLEAARQAAYRTRCRRLWLITTNDNLPAIDFYRRRGMKLVAIHKGALSESRKLKPEIPLFGLQGRPITDELEFELNLQPSLAA
jgi:ribosomal protein S18 acetylase RimI-like enzyme